MATILSSGLVTFSEALYPARAKSETVRFNLIGPAGRAGTGINDCELKRLAGLLAAALSPSRTLPPSSSGCLNVIQSGAEKPLFMFSIRSTRTLTP